MSDTRKQTAFRLPASLLQAVDEAVAAGRAKNRTHAVELALERWLPVTVGVVGEVDPILGGTGGFTVPQDSVAPRPLRPRKEHSTGSWLGGRQHLPTCKCAICKPKEAA